MPESVKWLKRFPWATYGRAEMPEEFFQKIAEEKNRISLLSERPCFSVVINIHDESLLSHAKETWESLILQSYPHWTAVVVAPELLRDKLNVPQDPRFQFATSSKDALWRVSGDWVGVATLGDVLSPSAFYELALNIGRHPSAVGFYSNEVEIEGNSVRSFYSKRSWSPLTLLHWNYVGRFWVLRRDQVYDLFDERAILAAAGESGQILHLPTYLYYRRSPSVVSEAKAPILPLLVPDPLPLTTAIICFRDKAEMTMESVKALIAIRGRAPLEIVLVDNDSSPEERAKIEPFLSTSSVPIKLVSFPGPFNFAQMNNWAAREHARGQLFLFLNNDVRLSRGDLATWVSWGLQPSIGTVGILLRFAHGGVQHSGIRAWFGGEARMVRIGNSHAEDAVALSTREVFANTFAASLVAKKTFLDLGGLRETDCANGFGDVAFCFEAIRRGYHHLYLGSIEGVHAESSSRGQPYEYWEECTLEREYPDVLQRMLRADLGINRVPGADVDISAFLFQAFKAKFRAHSRWLNPVKPTVKKWLRTWGTVTDGT